MKKNKRMLNNLTVNEKNLIRRYLVWCYKTTKEDLDRIDRKFTQLMVDDFVLAEIKKAGAGSSADHSLKAAYQACVDKFIDYIRNKEKGAQGHGSADYLYLRNRLAAIEKAISNLFSRQDLKKIISSYETEMTRRIWETREHS